MLLIHEGLTTETQRHGEFKNSVSLWFKNVCNPETWDSELFSV